MKLITFAIKDRNATRVGAVQSEHVYDLSQIASDMVGFLEGGQDHLERARRLVAEGRPVAALAEVTVHAPIPWPPKILALAGNYQEHLAEVGFEKKEKARCTPLVFMKPGTTVLAPGGTILRSGMTDQLDYELELGVVIGQRAKHIGVEQALDCVAGYTVTNDVSSRRLIGLPADRQIDARQKFFDWLMGKWQDTALPMGPWIVTGDELPDPGKLKMRLTVNGEVRQEANSSQMIFTVPEVVSFISRFLTLQPGDIICTGTPSGVGAGSGRFLQPGDKIVARIESIGELHNVVGEES